MDEGRIGGSPRCNPEVESGLTLLKQGKTYREVAEEIGVSISTLLRARRNARAEIQEHMII